MELSVMSTATSIQDVVMALKFGIQPERSLAGFWFQAELQTSALERKARCSFALSRSCGGCKWLARQGALYSAFDRRIMNNEYMCAP